MLLPRSQTLYLSYTVADVYFIDKNTRGRKSVGTEGANVFKPLPKPLAIRNRDKATQNLTLNQNYTQVHCLDT